MAAYIIADIDVHDWEAFQRYREQVPPIIARFGGRYIIRGGELEITEGNFGLKRLIVLEFPDMKTAREFYGSSEYQPMKELRAKSTISNVAFVAGYES